MKKFRFVFCSLFYKKCHVKDFTTSMITNFVHRLYFSGIKKITNILTLTLQHNRMYQLFFLYNFLSSFLKLKTVYLSKNIFFLPTICAVSFLDFRPKSLSTNLKGLKLTNNGKYIIIYLISSLYSSVPHFEILC
jgi:hypothetical protein